MCSRDECFGMVGYLETSDEAIAAWNTRTRTEANRSVREALEPFVKHGRAAGAFGEDPDPIRFYTDTGYREVPVEDFRRARAALTGSNPAVKGSEGQQEKNDG